VLNKKAARPGSYDPNWFLPNRNEEEPEEDQSHPMTARQLGKIAAMRSEIEPQEHQQRVADRLTTDNPRMLLYHGLGTGKSLASILGAETAKKKFNEDYGIVAPASLRENFSKEVNKFTTGSTPEIMSYTGLGLGKQFAQQPQTLIVDEAHRLRNPHSASSRAVADTAARAKRLLLLSGSPIVNSPTDLASPLSMLTGQDISPQKFEEQFMGTEKVSPGFFNSLRGIEPGERTVVKNEAALRRLLAGHVDYQPSKTPEGVSVNEEIVNVPLSAEQTKIQDAIRKKIPLQFLWKLDKEFPLSSEEVNKLNSFMTGLRQSSLSTQPFRADKDSLKAYEQSGKLQEAAKRLKEFLATDERKKAIIYSNFVGAGLNPYAAGLSQAKIPYGIFHGGIPVEARKKALNEYNAGKLRALLIGPAGAEGISTKGTNLIQLLDPHWHESRSNQAQGRGLRFDSHEGLPDELKNVLIQKYISASQEPGMIGKLLGSKRIRTGDEILSGLARGKEELNERFRQILREEGSRVQ
jgi:SNF2 family DNA or RNA helicase